ncbi:hypothetical protein [Streptomyces fodineus]|uniref:hypothetical protein n=1 Tax=Streptomyces fodineus TaxID=1904616 RepID=UPI001F2D8668|nr:hypothetical protein [Streptomyces fodineus]
MLRDLSAGDVGVGVRNALAHVDRGLVTQQFLHCSRQQFGVAAQPVQLLGMR